MNNDHILVVRNLLSIHNGWPKDYALRVADGLPEDVLTGISVLDSDGAKHACEAIATKIAEAQLVDATTNKDEEGGNEPTESPGDDDGGPESTGPPAAGGQSDPVPDGHQLSEP